MQKQRRQNKPTQVLPTICITLASTLIISQAVFSNTACAADANASAVDFGHSKSGQATWKVRRGDSLLKIARKLKYPKIHYYQLAVGIFIKNPQAFRNNNLSQLKAGVILNIPSPNEAKKISLAVAKQLIRTGKVSKKTKLPDLSNKPLKEAATKNTDTTNVKKKAIQKKSPAQEKTLKTKANSQKDFGKMPSYISTTKPTSHFQKLATAKGIVKRPLAINVKPKRVIDLSTTKEPAKPGKKSNLSKAKKILTDEIAIIEEKLRNPIDMPDFIGTVKPVEIVSSDSESYPKSTLKLVQRLPNASHQNLAKELLAINSIVDILQDQIPDTEQQSHDRNQYLLKLKQRSTDLDTLIKQFQDKQQKNQQLLKAQENQKEKLEKVVAFYKTSENNLKPMVRKANFISPKNINHRNALDPNSYFRNVATQQRWNSPLSPLLEKAEEIHCAQTAEEAKPVLHELFSATPQNMDWPDEWLGSKKEKAGLYAGSMDILLATLHRNISRFPELKELTERVTLQWNYCPVTDNGGRFYNLYLANDKLSLIKAADKSPLNWSGFQRWGFLIPPPPEQDRYVPGLLDVHVLRYAYETFLQRVIYQHCFPHPVTGEVYTETDEERVLTRVFHPPPPHESMQNYPYVWQPLCEIPETNINYAQQTAWPESLLQRASLKHRKARKELNSLTRHIAKLKKDQKVRQSAFKLASSNLQNAIKDLKHQELVRKEKITKQLENLAQQKQVAAQKKAEYEQQRLAALAEQQERKRQFEIEQRRLARIEAEEKRLAALEAEKIRQAKLKAVQERLAALKAEKKRLTALEAERKRLAALEAERKRLAALEAEKKRLAALKAEKKRLAALEAERKRLAVLEAEKKRQAALALSIKENLSTFKQRLANSNTSFPTLDVPSDDFVPMPDSAEATSPTVISSKKKDKLGISATFIHTWPVDGSKQSSKLSLSWKPPIKNFFVRGAAKYVKDEDFTYSWGIGFSDWRAGSTSVALNNWGPIKSGDGLALDKAVFSISHKIDSKFLKEHKISTAVGFSKPLSGDAGVSGTFQWSPVPNWYFRTTAAQKLNGGPTNWSYGFGLFNWRPNTWSLEYSNYGKNRYPFDNFEKGAVTLSRSWQF